MPNPSPAVQIRNRPSLTPTPPHFYIIYAAVFFGIFLLGPVLFLAFTGPDPSTGSVLGAAARLDALNKDIMASITRLSRLSRQVAGRQSHSHPYPHSHSHSHPHKGLGEAGLAHDPNPNLNPNPYLNPSTDDPNPTPNLVYTESLLSHLQTTRSRALVLIGKAHALATRFRRHQSQLAQARDPPTHSSLHRFNPHLRHADSGPLRAAMQRAASLGKYHHQDPRIEALDFWQQPPAPAGAILRHFNNATLSTNDTSGLTMPAAAPPLPPLGPNSPQPLLPPERPAAPPFSYPIALLETQRRRDIKGYTISYAHAYTYSLADLPLPNARPSRRLGKKFERFFRRPPAPLHPHPPTNQRNKKINNKFINCVSWSGYEQLFHFRGSQVRPGRRLFALLLV